VRTAAVRRTPYVPFDGNRYSIPHDRIQRSLTLFAELDRLRIFDRQELVAVHARSWDKGKVIELHEHLDGLWRAKRMARRNRSQERLTRTVPQAETLLQELARRQRHLTSAVDQLLRWLDAYGRDDLQTAIQEALDKGSPHPETVHLILDRQRQARGAAPPIPLRLPDDPRVRDLVVQPHSLADYDPEETP
jgi:hypothetical protein